MGRVPEIITILQWTDPLVFLRHLRTESKTSRDFTRVPNPAFKKLPLHPPLHAQGLNAECRNALPSSSNS